MASFDFKDLVKGKGAAYAGKTLAVLLCAAVVAVLCVAAYISSHTGAETDAAAAPTETEAVHTTQEEATAEPTTRVVPDPDPPVAEATAAPPSPGGGQETYSSESGPGSTEPSGETFGPASGEAAS